MAKTAAQEMITAQKIISNAVNQWKLKQLRKSKTFIADIYFEADPDIAQSIYLVGEFTTPQWEVLVQMKYSFFYRAFKVKIKIQEGCQFKFLVDGTFVCCPMYPLKYTKEKFSNNIFRTAGTDRFSSSQRFGNCEGVEMCFNSKRELYFRKKTSHIINKVTNFSFTAPKLCLGHSRDRLTYFSPDIKLSCRKNFKQHEIINTWSKFDNYLPTTNDSSHDEQLFMRGYSDFPIIASDSQNQTNGLTGCSQRFKYIVPSNMARTPMQKMVDPLQNLFNHEFNQSQRDELSDHSEDDLEFLDEYLKNTQIPNHEELVAQAMIESSSSSINNRENGESYIFVANGYKISKNKKPCGDAFFTSKYGLGVADGVGGWCAYGIDPSSFSQQLMNKCKSIMKKKEYIHHGNVRRSVMYSDKTIKNDLNKQINTSPDKTLSKISNAFGAPVATNKMKRIRSSFHLDEHCLREKEAKENGHTNKDEMSPASENTSHQKACSEKNIKIEPCSLLKQAYRSVTAFGSSTACICTINGRTLKVANIGDSSCILLRYFPEQGSCKLLLKTEEQQHRFNAPYQLANIPDHLKTPKGSAPKDLDKITKFTKDKISDAVIYQSNVKEGDILIAATDGLFDNLYIKEIQKIVEVFMTECMMSSSHDSLPTVKTQSDTPVFNQSQIDLMTKRNCKKLSQELVKEAYRKSKSRTCLTPFGDKIDQSKIEKDKERLKWKGGKPDDICAVVGFIKLNDIFSE